MSAATCRSLADATIVLIVLALQRGEQVESVPVEAADSASVSSRPSPSSATAAHTQPLALPAAPEPPPKVAARGATPFTDVEPATHDTDTPSTDAAPLRLGVAFSVALRLDVGTLPVTPGFGAEPRVGLRIGQLYVGAGATFWIARESAIAGYPNAAVGGRGVLGDVVLGWIFDSNRWSFAPELVAELGVLSLEVANVATPGKHEFSWTATGAGARAAFELSAGFELFANIAGLVPAVRPRTLLRTRRGDVTSFEMAAFLLRFSAGLAYVFE